MKDEKIANMMARLQRRRDAITAAHTPENEARLIAEAKAQGMKLTKKREGEEGYAFKGSKIGEIDGISLAEVDKLIRALKRTAS